MARTPALLTVVLASILAIALVWAVRRGEDTSTSATPPVPDLAQREREPTVHLASAGEPSGRSGATKLDPGVRPALGRAPSAANPEPADLVLVRVVEGPSRAPMADAEVSLQAPGRPTVYGITDENGQFDFAASEVPAAIGDRVSVVVKDEDGHERLRDGVVLARNVLLQAPSKAVLHGEIALTSGESPEWLYVSIWNRTRGSRGGETFVGYQNLGTNGRFAIPALGEPPPDFVRIEVARTGLPVSLSRSTAEMLVPPGPRIVVGLVRLQLAVVDENGDPVPEALVRCTATPDADARQPADELAVDPSTGSDGRARLWVPSGLLTVVAGANGHAPVRHVVRAEAASLELVLRLRKLGDSDRLAGSVVYEDGSAVPDLEVRAWNDDPARALERVSSSTARTDGDGRFVLPIATDQDVEVQAIDPGTRQPGVARWRPGDGPVRLVIDRGHALKIQARGLPVAEDGGAARVQIVLVRERGQSDALETDALPVTFDHVPAGRWSVFALDQDRHLWARGEAFLSGAAPEEITLEFESCQDVVGRVESVLDPELAYSVAFAPNGWPTDAVERLLTADVAKDGTFRLPAPGAGQLELREGYRMVERRPAVGGGAPLVFTLPD